MTVLALLTHTVRRTGCGLLVVALGSCQPLPTALEEVRLTYEVPSPTVAKTNAECVDCHADIGAEWSRSLHAQAYSDPVFQHALSIEPTPFCRGCHAPLSDPTRPPPLELAELGVACVSCHAPHATMRPAMSTVPSVPARRKTNPAACAGCHQFDFPDRAGLPMQDTLMEHRSSTHSDVDCQTCHMPLTGKQPHLDHEFRVSHNPAMLRRAIECKLERAGSASVRYHIGATNVGHSVPTGDIFRRLELRVQSLNPSTQEYETASPVVFARLAEPGQKQIHDTRVPPPGLGVVEGEVVFTHSITLTNVEWSLVYLRMSQTLYQTFGLDAEADAVVLCSGTLTAGVP